jgi:hypothetical protein
MKRDGRGFPAIAENIPPMFGPSLSTIVALIYTIASDCTIASCRVTDFLDLSEVGDRRINERSSTRET